MIWKRIYLVLFLVLAVGMVTAAQVEPYIGVGKLMTSESGNAFTYSQKFETNYQAGIRYWATPTFSFNGNIMRDTAKIGEWAYDHNVIKALPVHEYNYTAVGLGVEYWPMKDVFVFLAPTYFTTSNQGVESKWGIAAGAGLHHKLYKNLNWQTEVRFVHVEDFIVRNANGLIWSFGLAYKF